MIRTAALLPFLLLIACSEGTVEPEPDSEPHRLSNAEAWELIRDHCGEEEFCLMDIRTPDEIAGGYIECSKFIDWLGGEFEALVDPLPRDHSYLIYCRRGNRTQEARDKMIEMGFQHVFDLRDGWNAWVADGYPWTTE